MHTHTLLPFQSKMCLLHSENRLKVSVDVDYWALHLAITVGLGLMSCPCIGTCSAVGPWTRATYTPEITRPSSSPVTTSKSPPCGFHIHGTYYWLTFHTHMRTGTHTHPFVLPVIICVDENSKNTSHCLAALPRV